MRPTHRRSLCAAVSGLALPIASWDKVRDQASMDGYVRGILVNEPNSLWRRA